jgi:hypothetical protein
MKIEWNVERCPLVGPWVDVRVTREVIKGRRWVEFDGIFWTRRLLISLRVS